MALLVSHQDYYIGRLRDVYIGRLRDVGRIAGERARGRNGWPRGERCRDTHSSAELQQPPPTDLAGRIRGFRRIAGRWTLRSRAAFRRSPYVWILGVRFIHL